MESTLLMGDRVVADMRYKTVKRGDVVVFRFPLDRSKVFAKRVIGLPGDVIEIKDRTLNVDGKVPDEP
jgi:signal peptidase I